MRCLIRYVFTLFEVLYFISLMSVSVAYGHVGEKCPFVILFRMCMVTNSYCDNNNICQCKSDYPVKVDNHTCRKPRRIGDRCSVTAECSYLDSNAYCTQLSFRSVCECHEGFHHNTVKDTCEKIPKERSAGPSLVLPISIGLSVACLICCCLASIHIYRVRRKRHNRRNGSSRPQSLTGHWRSSSEAIRWSHRLPSTPSAPENIGTLPSYDVAVTLQPMKEPEMIDELPPTYDEVMKDS